MSTKAIRNALKTQLDSAMSPRPSTAWPNVSFDAGTLPRLEITFDGVERTGGTLKGNEVLREVGIFAVVVCVEQGQGEDAALDYADDIAAAFPEGQRIAFTGGEITITQPAAIRAGFPDKTAYRVPVVVRYAANWSI